MRPTGAGMLKKTNGNGFIFLFKKNRINCIKLKSKRFKTHFTAFFFVIDNLYRFFYNIVDFFMVQTCIRYRIYSYTGFFFK